jgi:hypothetical protein
MYAAAIASGKMNIDEVPPEFRDAAVSMLQLPAYYSACEVLSQPVDMQRERLSRVPETFRRLVRNEALRLREMRKSL